MKEPEYAPIRRQDRAKDEGWIRAFLGWAAYGHLATVQGGQPFLNANLFAYDDARRAIYLHMSSHGRTALNLQEPCPVCYMVNEMGRLLPAETAREVSVEYRGAVVFGQAQIVSDQEEATYGLQLLMEKYFAHLQPGRDYRPIQPEELHGLIVVRIDIESWSGKEKAAPADFPGAFFYRGKEEGVR